MRCIRGTNKLNKWHISHVDSVKQTDGYNCGPIACMYAWSILDGKMKYSLPDVDVNEYRRIVVNRYKQLLNKYKAQLGLEIRKKKFVQELENKCVICLDVVDIDISKADPMPCGHHNNIHHNCLLMWSLYNQNCPLCQDTLPKNCVYDIDKNFDTDAYLKKEECDEDVGKEISNKMRLRVVNDKKRKMYQTRQGNYMKKQYRHNVKLNLGTVVNLKVDKRDRKSTQIRALVGVVVKTTESDTSFLCGLATRHGIISSRNKIIMYDPASLVELPKPTIASELASIQKRVLNGETIIETLPKITVAKAYRLEYGTKVKNNSN